MQVDPPNYGSEPIQDNQLVILLNFPEVALWQLKLSGGRLQDVLIKLIKYFENKNSKEKE